MGKRRRHTFTRWIEDMVDDTKDLVDDLLDRVGSAEEDVRSAVKDVVGDDDDDDDGDTKGVDGRDVNRITAELTILSAALEELTAKVNALADQQAASTTKTIEIP